MIPDDTRRYENGSRRTGFELQIAARRLLVIERKKRGMKTAEISTVNL